MTVMLSASVGLLVGGPLMALLAAPIPLIRSRLRHRPAPPPELRLVLMLLLVELRSGASVLAALGAAARALPGYERLVTVSRIALVSGLQAAIGDADDRLRPIVAHLARAQRTGASLSGVVRRLLDEEIASERASRLARVRSLPVKLMVPVTLLMLPGLILMLYAPSLLGMFAELTGVLR